MQAENARDVVMSELMDPAEPMRRRLNGGVMDSGWVCMRDAIRG
jgi:hypothetical protein